MASETTPTTAGKLKTLACEPRVQTYSNSQLTTGISADSGGATADLQLPAPSDRIRPPADTARSSLLNSTAAD
ncbi:hypothetical protein PR202_gb28727 [Eleusine coracana subsp. coracana]|uniref:Uncharacterized protein n=1 Tax=Eleusine coracana subsp. coracana TaxID=191504 RepID=A0AAV5FYH6_ELECO|nr:hypothetical protein PR202_gb28727 [Eleusine coracana subsp. coracana]